MKRVGQMSGLLHEIEPGAVVTLSPPGGTFTPPLSGDRPVVLIAAGIGITPFVGYIEALAARPAHQRPPGVQLLYLCRNGSQHPFGRRLRQHGRRDPAASGGRMSLPARRRVTGWRSL